MKVCWVGVIGRPNVGKSTLINNLIQYDLSIISPKPQTTRDQILGLITTDDNYQIIFLDTPGIHKPQSKFGENLNKKAYDTIKEVDLLLFLQPANQEISQGDLMILDKIKNHKPKIAIVTKNDLVKNKEQINNKIIQLSEYNFEQIIPTSINKVSSFDTLLSEIKNFAYESEQLYEVDDITDKSELFLVREIIRSSVINNLEDELPHSVAIEITKYDIENNKRVVDATIYCKKESQKGIIIGKNGSMIKKIGIESRKRISQQFDFNIELNLMIKVNKNWINNDKEIKKMGY